MATTYEPIATGSGTNITFSSIPTTYTDLRVVYVTGSGSQNVDIRVNSDAGASSYNWLLLEGYGSTIATRYGTTSSFPPQYNHYSGIGFVTLDIMNYANTTAQKQFISTFQNSTGASGAIAYGVCRYANNAAISSISLLNNTITTATLYGIKAA